ncbi:hypothetical protein EPO15_13810 [bacterium]|nr:MAG: hypothetical protein EPO15_13810 [bacterium]
MADATRKGKAAFWALALGVLVLAGVPSVYLVESARDYWRFLRGWDPGVLKPTTTRRVPHRGEGGEPPDIRFVDFELKAPEAKSVALAASFNGFDAAALKLDRGADGVWRVTVPLPPGTYDYGFDVDGRWTVDPAGGRAAKHGGRDVTTREVE